MRPDAPLADIRLCRRGCFVRSGDRCCGYCKPREGGAGAGDGHGHRSPRSGRAIPPVACTGSVGTARQAGRLRFWSRSVAPGVALSSRLSGRRTRTTTRSETLLGQPPHRQSHRAAPEQRGDHRAHARTDPVRRSPRRRGPQTMERPFMCSARGAGRRSSEAGMQEGPPERAFRRTLCATWVRG